jgi:hypothetical protein
MPDPRNVLTPEALTMMDAIATSGSFAAAARHLGKVPSALTTTCASSRTRSTSCCSIAARARRR